MSGGFTVPPKADFDAFAALLDQQSDHFRQLTQWAGKECTDAHDLNGLLVLPVMELAPRIAAFFTQKLTVCQAGMTGVAGKARSTSQAYLDAERTNGSNFADIHTQAFGQALRGFPDLGKVPGLAHLGDFDDADVVLKEPDPAGDDTAKNISYQLMLLGAGTDPGAKGIQATALPSTTRGIGNFSGELLGMGDKLYRYFTGQSLVALLFDPLVGNYGRLKYLHEAYDQLSDGIYTVTGTIRKGSVRLGGQWQGDTATAFDSLMFGWSMGSGGIGDAARIVSDAYRDGYYAVCLLVQVALQAITRLVNDEVKQLVETAAGDAAIEAVGGGPEDPVADVVAAVWTVYKIYKIINRIVTAVEEIMKIYEDIKRAVHKIEQDVPGVIAAFQAPLDLPGTIHSLVDDVEQRGFEFEQSGGWSPALGVTRIAMLPSP